MVTKELVNGIIDEIILIRRQIHKHPELSMDEYKTTKLIKLELEKHGIEIQHEISAPGVVGIIRGVKKGRTIALRADIDALPMTEESGLEFSSENMNIAHTCGHDIHTSVLLGVGILLNEMKGEINGNIKLVFQPAEEKLAGSKKMIAEGALKNPNVDAILTAHCWPELNAGEIGIRRGPIMAAADEFDITVKGISGHAAHPHKAVDPLPIASQVIMALQTIISRETSPHEQAVVTIGTIKGGIARNIIANEVFLEGTVRTLNSEGQKAFPEKIKRIVDGITEGMNGKGIVDYRFGPPPVINDDFVMDVIENSLKKSIGETYTKFLESPSMGSEDFAYYLEHLPGALIRIGTGNDIKESRLSLHSPRIIFDENSIFTGILAVSNIAIDFLNINVKD